MDYAVSSHQIWVEGVRLLSCWVHHEVGFHMRGDVFSHLIKSPQF